MFEGVEDFVTVVEEGGFSAAARKLRRSNGHVTKQVQRLEARLGVQLLVRTTRSVSLTDEGAQYFAECQRIVNDARAADQMIRDTRSSPSGKLRVTAPVSFALGFLADHIPEFMSRYPEIEIDLDLSERKVDLLAEEIDVALRVGQLADNSMIARKISEMRGCVVAAPSYWAANGKPLQPDDLRSHQVIGFSLQRYPNIWKFSNKSTPELEVALKVPLLTNSAEMELALAINGQGVARLPDFVCQKAIDEGRLETALEDFASEPVGIYALYPAGSYLPAKTRVFIDFLVQQLS